MRAKCPKCFYDGETLEESFTDEDGSCDTEHFCTWCDAVITLKDIAESENPLCVGCGKNNKSPEWGNFCSAECLQLQTIKEYDNRTNF